ncbi:sulfate transporter [Streptomyces purpurascens]
MLALIPSALAGVLVHSGWKLFAPAEFPKGGGRTGEFAVMTLTTLVIADPALLEAAPFGVAADSAPAALRMRRRRP